MRPVTFPLSIRELTAEQAVRAGGFDAGWYVLNAGHTYGGVPMRLLSAEPFVVSHCCATYEAARDAHERLCEQWDDFAMLDAELGETEE